MTHRNGHLMRLGVVRDSSRSLRGNGDQATYCNRRIEAAHRATFAKRCPTINYDELFGDMPEVSEV